MPERVLVCGLLVAAFFKLPNLVTFLIMSRSRISFIHKLQVEANNLTWFSSGLALWNLSSMDKPRFTKLKGQIVSFDLWEELLLVLGKGGAFYLKALDCWL